MSVRLPVRNHGERMLAVYIEPIAADYWLRPDEELTVLARDGAQFSVSVGADESGEQLTVWIYQDGDPHQVIMDYQVLDARGTELEYGYQRVE
ncbi:hypothetical protein N8J89_30070 [Crossiella sp. CA-258035]|uniref:hypothetical protein n=1 Tax=Crossiella sp. CA-258035 TaxID=2981138 RepID=UPI0024BC2F22|nr:hypothetical protein [Crossiella sp. CA-258035]WHT17351.1 hypothetical protein N8J89_30070 [Crossiella sp. CA-258035]